VNSLYFLIVGLALFAHALAADAFYKLFQLSCLCGTLFLAYRGFHRFSKRTLYQSVAISLYPIVLIILSLLAGVLPETKNSLQLIFYTSIPIGMLFASTHRRVSDHEIQRIFQFAILFVVGYAALEVVSVFVLGKSYGTLRNPHYLAQYCLLLLFAGFFLFHQATTRWQQLLLALAILALGILLIFTRSRPAWLALVLSCVVFFSLQRYRFSWRIPSMVVTVILAVYVLNAGGVRDRVNDLVFNVAHEERVTIWHDALTLQLESSPRQWLFGHGINRFYEEFKPYSEYQAKGKASFTTPHNYLIEVLFSIGLTGLLASGGLVLVLYWRLYRQYHRCNQSFYVTTLITILTANLLFTSITISFFRSYNLLILALIGGLLIVHENTYAADHAHHPQL
jgi:O-antigen ligase